MLARVDGKLVPIPINLDTVNKLYDLNLTEDTLEDFFMRRPRRRNRSERPRTL